MAEKEAKTTRRMVTQSVTVIREGKRVSPEIGKSYPFTEAEIEYLDRLSPAATRKSVNEDPIDAEEEVEGGDTGDDETAPDKNAKPTATKTPKKGKKAAAKKAEADEDEEEDDDI